MADPCLPDDRIMTDLKKSYDALVWKGEKSQLSDDVRPIFITILTARVA